MKAHVGSWENFAKALARACPAGLEIGTLDQRRPFMGLEVLETPGIAPDVVELRDGDEVVRIINLG